MAWVRMVEQTAQAVRALTRAVPGLLSVLLGRVCRPGPVFATDCARHVLDLCAENVAAGVPGGHDVRVRQLDWREVEARRAWPEPALSAHSWHEEDLRMLPNVMWVLGSDLIYDDSLTPALFAALRCVHACQQRDAHR